MIEKLDLDLAFNRTLYGLNEEVNFIDRSLALQLIQRNYEAWKEELSKEIESGYEPSDATPFLVPKGGDLVRNGSHLTIKDRTIYNACVTALQPDIYGAVGWSQGEIDISYQLSNEHELEGWFDGNYFHFWEQFREDTISKLDSYKWLAEADIASYYDNIDIRSLESDLEREEVDKDINNLLVKCLQRWSTFEGRGIPQAHNASHILAKLYLNTFDEEMNRWGFDHLRYNDDIRVFCETRAEARQAVKKIFSSLSQRGLSLQSAKTKISKRESAVRSINKVQEIIDTTQNQQESIVQVETSGTYNDVFLSLPPEDIDDKVIQEATQRYLIEADEDEFSSTLFHYLINRLGKIQDGSAVEYCLSLLEERPEETPYSLEYLERLGVTDKMRETITDYLYSEKTVYEFQLHLIYEWFLESNTNHITNERLISKARSLAFDGDRDFYLRNTTRRYLGRYGVPGDLIKLEKEYSATSSVREQVVILASLENRVRSKRNGFYAGVKDDGWAHKEVVELIKTRS
jgi:retron-type reverse transcriptase